MIKEKYIDAVKSRIDIYQLVMDLCPGVTLHNSGKYRKKCCCVFHNEKTPSLYLDLSLNRYKCFGCGKGGDIINFVQELKGLDFVDAVKFLLKTYCPDVDTHDLYHKQTEEEIEAERHRESLFICTQVAYDFYRQQYEADTEESIRCRIYAEGRWEREFCKTFGLGYAPQRGNQFLAYAKKQGLRMEYLLELGLIAQEEDRPNRYYDFYRGRLMIPQRDRYGRIVTFTARSLSPQSTHKYLNGKDSPIYKKSQSIFGIDVALRAARQYGKVYLVEGAPDVMRLQSLGIPNAVASLGGVWSKEQLNTFSRFGCSLCFIPDADVPKDGEQFGKGEQFVFQNGRLATELGFQVSVREIPSDGQTKQDADSYITDMERWETLTERDFILWYADKHYDQGGTNDDQLKAISETCDLLVHVESDVMQASLLSDLKGKFKKASVWKTALADAARRLQEQKHRQAMQKDDELEGYRFYRRGRHYYDLDQQGRERDWTNFVIRPLFLIADDKSPTRIFELENESGIRKTIELRQMDVTKLDRFKDQIEGKGNFRFFERQEKYELLKAFMYEKTEEAVRVPQMGWNNIGEKGFYAFCNGIVYGGEWQPVDDYGIIRLDTENFYLPAMSKIHKSNRTGFVNERRFMHKPTMDVTLKQYFSLIVDLYGDNGVVALCFYMASLFRDIIVASTRSFPLLNIYGKKGTGKTEFAISIVSLFQRNPEVSNLESTTYYAMGDKCAEVSNMIVHFDEYKNSLSHKHIDFLKGIYDNAGRSKRSADGERRESTNVDCGVLLTGQEMPTADSALFSRVLFLESQRSERTKEETDKFHHLLKLRNACPTNITVELLRYRDNFEARWHDAWERSLSEIKDGIDYHIIGERFINNWAMMLATYYTLEPFVKDLPFTAKRVREICLRGLEYQHSLCNSTDEISMFWSMFSKSRQIGDIREGQDYKISYVKNLKVSQRKAQGKTLTFEHETYILFVREKICLAKANIQAKREGKQMIPDESLLSYLTSTSEYLGKTSSPLKFYVYDESGNPVRKTNENGDCELFYDQERVLAFDYDSVCTNYDIDLRTLKERVGRQPSDHQPQIPSDYEPTE
ncbi:CHC2 zinc finger domain-containing protein [Prevotella nigrescens]|jgi:DNA primase|uniref:DNA primase n=1 Tax=Prevotella nigrescens TaxID=28133 RepID=UPI00352D27C2